jgi:hypothetical protein
MKGDAGRGAGEGDTVDRAMRGRIFGVIHCDHPRHVSEVARMRPQTPRFTLVLRSVFRSDGPMQEVWLDT